MPTEAIIVEDDVNAGNAPVVVEFGKASKKEIKRLMNGDGELFERVAHTLEELRDSGTISANAQPVIIVVKQKAKRKSAGWLFS
jgi:hypothetical protein